MDQIVVRRTEIYKNLIRFILERGLEMELSKLEKKIAALIGYYKYRLDSSKSLESPPTIQEVLDSLLEQFKNEGHELKD